MAIIIKRGKTNIRIRSVFVDFLKTCLFTSKKRKIFILVFLIALPIGILVWFGLLGSLAFVLFFGLSGLYLLITSSMTGRPFGYLDFAVLFVNLAGCCAGIWYFKNLRGSFKSGEIIIESLLPGMGAIVLLLVLIRVAIWLAIL
jgi:hypothetical protein